MDYAPSIMMTFNAARRDPARALGCSADRGVDPAERLHRRLQRALVVGWVVTALVIGGVASGLFYVNRATAVEQELMGRLAQQAAALEAELTRYRQVAAQITSRTRIRERLEAYNRGEVDRSALRGFSEPKLADAMREARDLIGIQRRDATGQPVVSVGPPLPAELVAQSRTTRMAVRLLRDRGQPVLGVAASIRDPAGHEVGSDVVAFRADSWVADLERFAQGLEAQGAILLVTAEAAEFERLWPREAWPGPALGREARLEHLRTTLAGKPPVGAGLASVSSADGRWRVAAHPLAETSWILVFQGRNAQVLAPAIRDTGLLAGMMILLLGLGLVATQRAMRPLTRRVEATRAAQKALWAERDTLLGHLQQTEARLAEAERLAGFGSWQREPEGQGFWCSRGLCAILEIDPAIGLPSYEAFLQFVPASDQAAVQRVCAASGPEGGPYELEHRLQLSNGRVKYVHQRCTAVQDARGGSIRVLGTTQDVTQSRVAHEALAASEQRYRNVVDNLKEVVFQTDAEGRWTFLNPAWTELTGFSVETSLGRPFLDYVHPADQALNQSEFEPLMREEKSACRHAIRYRHARGGVVWMEVFARLTRGADRSIIGTSGTLNDITERKQAEMERAWQGQFRNLLLELSTAFINVSVEAVDPAIQRALGAIGGFVDAQHAAIYRYDFEAEVATCAFGWDAIGRAGCVAGDTIDLEAIAPWVSVHLRGEIVHVADVATLSPGGWRDRLQRDGIARVLALPLAGQEGCLGFVSFEFRPDRSAPGADEHRLLQLFSQMLVNVEERRASEQELRLAANVFSSAQEGILLIDTAGTILKANAAFTRMTGYGLYDLIGRPARAFLPKAGGEWGDSIASLSPSATESPYWTGELWNQRKTGEWFAALVTVSTVPGIHGERQHYVALYSDITDQKRHAQQLEHIAHYDALTHLPNRLLLADRLRQAMATAQQQEQLLAVVYLDLDGFKEINDTYGHEWGDQVLMTVASRMGQSLRPEDTIGRLGGDEFVAVLVNLPDITASMPLVTELLAAASQPLALERVTLQVSASIGVTAYPQGEPMEAEQLLRQADQAMYQAKLAGKNRYYFFDAAHDRDVRDYHEHLGRVRKALYQNELTVYFQPKVDLRSGVIRGAEALLRWRHPERGLLSPALFLPGVEDSPLAVELGEWVLEQTLIQLARWRAQGRDWSVSVNVGALQLQRTDFMERLRGLLAAYPEVPAGRLELEILESHAVQDIEHVSSVIRECRQLGIPFALDDFGTGYSSLTYLRRLPASQLKIDQSFVRNMLDRPDDLAIVAGIIGLVTAFRVQIIAEGIETLAHGETLIQLGCAEGQGYAIAPPMTAEGFLEWARHWAPPARWAQQGVLRRDTLPLLLALAEYRAWRQAIDAYLNGTTPDHPPLRRAESRFGQWLGPGVRERYAADPHFRHAEGLHARVDAILAEFMALDPREWEGDAHTYWAQLYTALGRLIHELEQILTRADAYEPPDSTG